MSFFNMYKRKLKLQLCEQAKVNAVYQNIVIIFRSYLTAPYVGVYCVFLFISIQLSNINNN